MITQKEKQLGSLFAKLAAIGVAANFVVGIGPLLAWNKKE